MDSDGETEDQCTICKDRIYNRATTDGNGCEHAFCYQCIWKWARRTHRCPLCRKNFKNLIFENGIVEAPANPEIATEPNLSLAPIVVPPEYDEYFDGAVGQGEEEEETTIPTEVSLVVREIISELEPIWRRFLESGEAIITGINKTIPYALWPCQKDELAREIGVKIQEFWTGNEAEFQSRGIRRRSFSAKTSICRVNDEPSYIQVEQNYYYLPLVISVHCVPCNTEDCAECRFDL